MFLKTDEGDPPFVHLNKLDNGGAVEEKVLYICTPRGGCVPYIIIASTLMRRCCMHCREKENRIAMTRCYPGGLLLRAVSFRAVYTALRRYYAKAMPKFNSFERQSTGSYRGIADKMGIPSHIQDVRSIPQPPTVIDFL